MAAGDAAQNADFEEVYACPCDRVSELQRAGQGTRSLEKAIRETFDMNARCQSDFDSSFPASSSGRCGYLLASMPSIR